MRSGMGLNYKILNPLSFFLSAKTFRLHPSDLHFALRNQEKLNYFDLKRCFPSSPYLATCLPDFLEFIPKWWMIRISLREVGGKLLFIAETTIRHAQKASVLKCRWLGYKKWVEFRGEETARRTVFRQTNALHAIPRRVRIDSAVLRTATHSSMHPRICIMKISF